MYNDTPPPDSRPISSSLYDLLPAYVRQRDRLQGHDLRILMEALEGPYRLLEDDIAGLYRNWFIETCDLWLVPYFAELLDVRGLDLERHLLPSQRARIADTGLLRRIRGTIPGLGRSILTSTGWPTHVHAGRDLMARAHNLREPLQSARPLTPTFHSPHVDAADPWHPWTTVPNFGGRSPAPSPSNLLISLWRLRARPLERATPRRCGPGRFTFHPFGVAAPLFNQPHTPPGIIEALTPLQIPEPLRPEALRAELELHRRGADLPLESYFGPVPTLGIEVRDPVEGDFRPLLPREIAVESLPETGNKDSFPTDPDAEDGPKVLFDPERGVLQFVDCDPSESDLRVSCSFGFGTDLGGGSYSRHQDLVLEAEPEIWQAVVWREWSLSTFIDWLPTIFATLRELAVEVGTLEIEIRDAKAACHTAEAAQLEEVRREKQRRLDNLWGWFLLFARLRYQVFANLRDALAVFEQYVAALEGGVLFGEKVEPSMPGFGLIWFLDSSTEAEPDGEPRDLQVCLGPGERLLIQAADGQCPMLRGDLRVELRAPATDDDDERPAEAASLALSGLWIDGTIRIEDRIALRLEHCTVAPPRGGDRRPAVIAGAAAAHVEIRRSIVGPLELDRDLDGVEIIESILDGGGGFALASGPAPRSWGPPLTMDTCTVLGEIYVVQVRTLVDCLLARPMEVEKSAVGEIHSSFLPWSELPLPSLHNVQLGRSAFGSFTASKGIPLIAPVFLSRRYGDPSYARLSSISSRPILTGNHLGNEVGVFGLERFEDRLQNLRQTLDDEAPWPLEPLISFAT